MPSQSLGSSCSYSREESFEKRSTTLIDVVRVAGIVTSSLSPLVSGPTRGWRIHSISNIEISQIGGYLDPRSARGWVRAAQASRSCRARRLLEPDGSV